MTSADRPIRCIRLELPAIDNLFVDPAFSMQAPHRPALAGLEQARREIMAGSARGPVRLRIDLDEPPPAKAVEAARAAWPARCRALALEHRQNAAAMRASGRLALILGLAVMIVCMAIAAGVDHFEPLPRLLNRLLEDGLVILGWVALWRPLDLLLFDGSAELRRARAYERLAESDLEVAG